MTKERIQPIAKEKTPIKDDLRDLSKNVPWMVLFAATILFILFICIRLSVTAHYFKYFVGEQEVRFFGKQVASSGWRRPTTRWGRRWRWSASCWCPGSPSSWVGSRPC